MKELLKLDVRILGKTEQITIKGGGTSHEDPGFPECPPIDPTVPHFPGHDDEFCDS